METTKPFLKWPGGKSKLITKLQPFIPEHIDHYSEPFLGGGSMLLYILSTHPELKSCVANDINSKLISTYIAVQQQTDNLLEELYNLKQEYLSLKSHQDRTQYFLDARDKFNKLSDISPIQQDYNSFIVEIGALLIFLNHTCFNGLYRENSKGYFNSPHGKYNNPAIFNESNIKSVAKLIKNVNFTYGDFQNTLKPPINTTDTFFTYLDPPYTKINNNSFTSYSKDGFSNINHISLANKLKQLSLYNNFLFTLSNSSTNNQQLTQLYNHFYISSIYAPRFIAANPNNRSDAKELIVSNICQK